MRNAGGAAIFREGGVPGVPSGVPWQAPKPGSATRRGRGREPGESLHLARYSQALISCPRGVA